MCSDDVITQPLIILISLFLSFMHLHECTSTITEVIDIRYSSEDDVVTR